MLSERQVLPKENILTKVKLRKTEIIAVVSVLIVGSFLLGWFVDGEPYWLMNSPSQNIIAYPFIVDDQQLQFDFVKMDSLVIEGNIAKLTYQVDNHSADQQSYSVVTEIIGSGDYKTEIKNGDILNKKQTELRSINAGARDRYDVEIQADCNQCRNSVGVKITLYDEDWNEIQSQDMRLNIFTPYIYRIFN